MENKNIPFKPNKEFKYSITYTITTDDSAEMGEYADSGFEVEPTESAIGEIIKMAHRNYGIYNPIAIGRWESTSPIEDKNYFEKGESRFFNLHITNIDGSDLDEEEHEFITYLLTEGEFDQSDYEDFGMGGSTSSKLSWHQDRARYNKSEDYEIPMSKRKFDDGGGVDDFKMSYDEMTAYEKSNHIHYNPMNSRWEVTKNGEHKEFWNQEQAEKYAGFEFDDEKDSRYSRKRYEALFGYSDGGDISEEANLRNRISNLKRLYNMVNESEKADLKYTIDNLEAQQRNLHKMEKGGSTSSKLSWHQDRARYNKSEDYEIPMSKRKFDDGGGVNSTRYNLHFNYNPSNLSNEDAENIVSKYTKDWKHNNDWDEVSFYVFGLKEEKANELKAELSGYDTYNVEIDKSRYNDGGEAGGWSVTDISNAKYLGVIEFQDNEGEFHNFEIMETDDRLVFGGMTNSGFIESGYIEKDGFSTDESLQSLIEDLEVYYKDGGEYTSQIVFNQRMAKGGGVGEKVKLYDVIAYKNASDYDNKKNGFVVADSYIRKVDAEDTLMKWKKTYPYIEIKEYMGKDPYKKYAKGGGVGEKVFEAQEDGVLGIYEGSDAYSIQISKGDTFMTFGKQDNPSWWYVKKVDKNTSPMSEISWDYSNSKSNVNVDWDKLILTFPKGDKMIYAEMTEKYAVGGGVDAQQKYEVTLKNDKHYGQVGVSLYGWNLDKRGTHYLTLQFPNGSVSTYGEGEIKRIYADGGEAGELPSNLKRRLANANNILKKYGGRELTEKEAIRFNIDHNSQSGFQAGEEAFNLSGVNTLKNNPTKREYETIGDALIDISRKMTGVEYDLKEYQIQEILQSQGKEFAKGGGVEDWMETALNDLKEKSSFDDLEIEYPQENTFSATNGDVEYFVCKDDDVAEDFAIERVMEDMNENPEYFNREFIMNHIDCGDFFENIYREWNMGYATDISTEDDDQYGNRLIAEMVEWGIMSKEDAKGDDAEEIMSERMEDFVEAITEDQLGQDEGFQYYVDNFGEEEAFNIAIDNGLIDIKEASEEAVSIDGIGHFLSSYDGKMLYLENGSVAFRNN